MWEQSWRESWLQAETLNKGFGDLDLKDKWPPNTHPHNYPGYIEDVVGSRTCLVRGCLSHGGVLWPPLVYVNANIHHAFRCCFLYFVSCHYLTRNYSA